MERVFKCKITIKRAKSQIYLSFSEREKFVQKLRLGVALSRMGEQERMKRA
jgi:hypothetical protein